MISLKTINKIVIASGLREPYWQSITAGLMLCFFTLFQSVITALRIKNGVRNGEKLEKEGEANTYSLFLCRMLGEVIRCETRRHECQASHLMPTSVNVYFNIIGDK